MSVNPCASNEKNRGLCYLHDPKYLSYELYHRYPNGYYQCRDDCNDDAGLYVDI